MSEGAEARRTLEQLREFPDYANKQHPIHRAAGRGDVAFLRTLRDNLDLSKINMRDTLGATPLHVAAREGRHECLQWLLDNTSLSVRERASAGETAVHVSAARGHVAGLRLLVRRAGSPAERAEALLAKDGNQLTALHLAALKGHQPAVNWIVMEYKAFLSPLMETGSVTPAHLAASEGHLEVLRTLLSSANRFNGWGEALDPEGTPIAYFAAQEGRLECLKFLVEEISVAPKARCQDGMTGMHAAAQSGHDVIIKYYAGRLGSDVITWKTNDGAIPLHFAAGTGHSSTVELLLGYDEGGVTIGMTDDNLMTSLHEAVVYEFPDCARILISAGAEVSAENEAGKSALSLVSQDAFHPCHAVVMEASTWQECDSVDDVTEETPVSPSIPELESGNQGTEFVQTLTHSIASIHSTEPNPLLEKRKSLGELSYLLSPLLSDPVPLPPATKLLAGMGHRTARRKRRWLSRPLPPVLLPLPSPPSPPSPPVLSPPQESPQDFSEQIKEASHRLAARGAQSEPPRRQLGSLVLERMNCLGGEPVLPPPEPVGLEAVPEETGKEITPVPVPGSGKALPGDLPVSAELEFFYGDRTETDQSDSETTLLRMPVRSASSNSAEETGSEPDESPDESTEGSVSEEREGSVPVRTGHAALPEIEFIEIDSEPEPGRSPEVPALGLPPLAAEEILASGFQEERRGKRRFSGLRRLLGRREREGTGGEGEGLAAFEAIMQRNLIIQEQIRSAPYPQLPPDILEPVAARGPADTPAWPDEILAEAQSARTPPPPSSSSESVPEVTARHIRSSAPQSPLRPVSTTIAIQTEAPYQLADPPAAPFTSYPAPAVQDRSPVQESPEVKRAEVSSRIASLAQSLMEATGNVERPYSRDAVYSPRTTATDQAPGNAAPHKDVPTEKEKVVEQFTPQTLISQSEAVARSTSGYDVPSWGEAREYLRRVTARQEAGPAEYEDEIAPVDSETGVAFPEAETVTKEEAHLDEATEGEGLPPLPLPPLSRSPRLLDLTAVASGQPAVPRPEEGTEVQILRQMFSNPHTQLSRPVDQLSRPVNQLSRPVNQLSRPVNQLSRPVNQLSRPVNQLSRPVNQLSRPVNQLSRPVNQLSRTVNQRIAALKRESPATKPVGSPAVPVETVAGPVRPAKSLAVKKLSSVREEVPAANQILMEMLLRKPTTSTPLDLLIEKSELARNPASAEPAEGADTGVSGEGQGEEGGQGAEGGGKGSMRTEVQGLSLSGQVRERMKLFN